MNVNSFHNIGLLGKVFDNHLAIMVKRDPVKCSDSIIQWVHCRLRGLLVFIKHQESRHLIFVSTAICSLLFPLVARWLNFECLSFQMLKIRKDNTQFPSLSTLS